MSSTTQNYIDLYAAHRNRMMEVAPQALNARRDEAMDNFSRMGLPTQSAEQYRYIDADRAFSGTYRLSLPTSRLMAEDAPVAVNNSQLLDKYYATCADADDPIVALNTAFATECLCVHVGKDINTGKPLEINDVLNGDTSLMEHKRILIVLDEGASLTMLMHYVSTDRQQFLTTQVVEVFVADGARLDIYEIEETHTACTRFSNIYFHIGSHATVRHNNIVLWGGITRNTLAATLCGEQSEVTLNGCVMADKRQQVDINTLIRHEVPRCTSHELYKFVVDEQATGAFAGKVYVAPDAQQTESDEVNQNICISPDAHMYAQPMLEIYADDVKCSHGSTVGRLDESALFYLRQRGIPLQQARQLLIQAFISQVVDYIPLETLRQRLHDMVADRLSGELDQCVGCGLCQPRVQADGCNSSKP
ncbi:MAG: Fe-S cluster assembly protein SufD [Bacteroidaceae bacterium]|nr:Fe-S cluster assembly protein SufD [Bacteroidaceae bacterium]